MLNVLIIILAAFFAVNMGGASFAAAFAPSYGGKVLSSKKAGLLFITFVLIGAVTFGNQVSTTLGENMEAITWPVAVSIMGTLVIIAGFLMNWIKKNDAPWGDDIQKTEDKLSTSIRENEHRTTVMEGKQHELVRRVDELKLDLKEIEESSDKKMEKIEEKLEKITQLMIDILQNANTK